MTTSNIIEYRVLFPLIGTSSRLAEISISSAGIYNQSHKMVSGGPRIYYLNKENEIDEILRKSRFKEHSGKEDLYVMAEFYNTDNCKMTGQSYALSLILADKLARIYQPTLNFKIIATGKIDRDQKIKAIGFFEEKLRYILQQSMDKVLNKGDYLFLSTENIQQANEAEKELLKILKKRGIKIFSVEDIEGLDKQLVALIDPPPLFPPPLPLPPTPPILLDNNIVFKILKNFKFSVFIINLFFLILFNLFNFYTVTILLTPVLIETIHWHFVFIAILGIILSLVIFTISSVIRSPSKIRLMSSLPSPRILSFFFAIYAVSAFFSFNDLIKQADLNEAFKFSLFIASIIAVFMAVLFFLLIQFIVDLIEGKKKKKENH